MSRPVEREEQDSSHFTVDVACDEWEVPQHFTSSFPMFFLLAEPYGRLTRQHRMTGH